MNSLEDIRAVAPALHRYTRETLQAELWTRPGLSSRDRSIVTLAALITRNLTAGLAGHVATALDHGVKPMEISEIITHLAFYAGWENALAAASAARPVFLSRDIREADLPPESPPLVPINEAVEGPRLAGVAERFGSVAPGVVHFTDAVVFRDLWLRPHLAPRDRSLVTVAALVASGQVAQLTYHLARAMDVGLTRDEAGEALTHLAFYAGLPNVFSAMPVAKEVFDKRGA